MIKNSTTDNFDFYNNNNQPNQNSGFRDILLKNVTNLGYNLTGTWVLNLHNQEAYIFC